MKRKPAKKTKKTKVPKTLLVCGGCLGEDVSTGVAGTYLTDLGSTELYCYDCGESTYIRSATKAEERDLHIVNERAKR